MGACTEVYTVAPERGRLCRLAVIGDMADAAHSMLPPDHARLCPACVVLGHWAYAPGKMCVWILDPSHDDRFIVFVHSYHFIISLMLRAGAYVLALLSEYLRLVVIGRVCSQSLPLLSSADLICMVSTLCVLGQSSAVV